MELEKMRQKIDVIDKKLIELIEERFLIAKKIGEYKKKNGLPVIDVKREKELALYEVTDGLIKRIFREIIACSRSIQEKL